MKRGWPASFIRIALTIAPLWHSPLRCKAQIFYIRTDRLEGRYTTLEKKGAIQRGAVLLAETIIQMWTGTKHLKISEHSWFLLSGNCPRREIKDVQYVDVIDFPVKWTQIFSMRFVLHDNCPILPCSSPCCLTMYATKRPNSHIPNKKRFPFLFHEILTRFNTPTLVANSLGTLVCFGAHSCLNWDNPLSHGNMGFQ